MKLKSFSKAKDTVNRTKQQPMEWEKIFTNSMSDREVMSKIHEGLKKLDISKPNDLTKYWGTDLNRELSTEGSEMAEKHLKKYASIAIREIQIKPTLRFHPTPVRMADTHNTNDSSCC